MLVRRTPPARLFGLVLAVVTLTAAVPVAVHHHADHPDQALHLEHAHGGHGGLLEQDDARLPGPHAPPLLPSSTVALPDFEKPVTGILVPDERLTPRGRAPPPDLPRAPPHLS